MSARGFTNIKTVVKDSKTGIETMQHHPYRSEITYPKSGKVIKEKSL